MSKTLDTRSLIEDAYRKLKQFMLQQKIVPGQKLLYRELTDLLHMSKTPIVNALNRLEQEGFVASEPNCGYYLKPISAKEVMDSSEVREALEARAIQQAVQLGTPDDMALLEKRLLALEAYAPRMHDRKRFVLNAEFHLQIADISQNRVLKYLLKRNFEHIILRVNLHSFALESTAASSQDHRKLLAGLKKGDVPRSIGLIQEHVRNTRDAIIRFLSTEKLADLETMDFFEEGRRAF